MYYRKSVAFTVIEANYLLFLFFFPSHFVLSVDNCKSNEQTKKEKQKPPGTVEYTVSECSHPLTSTTYS